MRSLHFVAHEMEKTMTVNEKYSQYKCVVLCACERASVLVRAEREHVLSLQRKCKDL